MKKLSTELQRPSGMVRVESFLVGEEEIPIGEQELLQWYQQWLHENSTKFKGCPIFIYRYCAQNKLYICSVQYHPADEAETSKQNPS